MNVNLPEASTKRGADVEQLSDRLEETKQASSSGSSEDSEGADHTYNPYSFKRLQNAIFERDSQ